MGIKFDSIVTRAFGSDKVTEQGCALYDLARDLDGLSERIARDSREMAERFYRYADEVECGSVHTPPTGWSTLNQMTEDAATYRAKLDAFKAFFRVVTGRKLREVRDELELEAEKKAPVGAGLNHPHF